MSKSKVDAPAADKGIATAQGHVAEAAQPHPEKQAGPQHVAPDRDKSPNVSHSQSGAASNRAASIRRMQKTHGNAYVNRFLSRERKDDNKSNPSVGPETRAALRAAGEGQPLPDKTRDQMQRSYGSDLSAVRVHTDSQADKANRELNANAFASGQNVYFAQGKFQPDTAAGKHLIAHELAHTIQQRDANVSKSPAEAQAAPTEGEKPGHSPIGKQAAGTVTPPEPATYSPQVSKPGDRVEREAESAAQQVSAGKPVAADTITRMPAQDHQPARQTAEAAPATSIGRSSEQQAPVNKKADAAPWERVTPMLSRAATGMPAPAAATATHGMDKADQAVATSIHRAPTAGANAGAAPPTAPAASPPASGVGDKGVSLMSPTFVVPAGTEQSGSRGNMDVPVHFGKLASGNIKVRKHGDKYSTPSRQMISLSLPALEPLRAVKVEPVLAVDIKDSAISGYVTVARGDHPAGNPEALMEKIKAHSREFGWAGIDVTKLPDVKSSLKDGTLTFQAENFPTRLGGFLQGTASFGLTNEQVTFTGQANIAIGGLTTGSLDLKRDEKGVISGNTEVDVSLAKFSGKVNAKFAGGIVDIEGTVGYKAEKFSGEVTLLLVDAATADNLAKQKLPPEKIAAKGQEIKAPAEEGAAPKPGPRKMAGYGTLDFALTDWLTGKATVIIDGKGDITVIGKIAPPMEKVLFEQQDYAKQLFKLEIRAPYGIPVVGNVFLFANIALIAEARIGPAKIYNIEIEGTYSTSPEVLQDFQMAASFNMSAYAGLKLRGEGGVGLEILSHDIKAGAGINAIAGVKGYVDARPTIGYREKADPKAGKKGEFFIKGHMELSAQPFLGLGGDLFVEIDSPWWSPLPDKKWSWPLGQLEYPLPGEFGLGADIDYVLGSKEWPQVKFSEAKFDANKFMTDIMREQAPKKSGKGEQQKPADFKESSDTKGVKQGPGGKAAAAGGAKPGKGADPGPAKSPVQPGGKKKDKKPPTDPKAKAEGDKKKQDALKGGKKADSASEFSGMEVPVTMVSTSHKLILAPGSSNIELASKRDLLSNKIGRAVGTLIKQTPPNPKRIDELKKIGLEAKTIQKLVSAIGKNPKTNLTKAGDQSADIKEKVNKLAGKIAAYAKEYNVQDIEEMGAKAGVAPRGDESDPIPLVWYKPLNNYKTVSLTTINEKDGTEKQENYKYNGQSQYFRVAGSRIEDHIEKGWFNRDFRHHFSNERPVYSKTGKFGISVAVKLGVAREHIPNYANKWRLISTEWRDVETEAQRAFRATLLLGGHNMQSNGEHADHVQDLQFVGMSADVFGNLWPLAANINTGSNLQQFRKQNITYTDKSGKVQQVELKAPELKGKYFRIVSFKVFG